MNFKYYFLCFCTDKPEQKVKTHIRLLVEEKSDQVVLFAIPPACFGGISLLYGQFNLILG